MIKRLCYTCLLLSLSIGFAGAQQLYPVKTDTRFGFIDQSGTLIINAEFDDVRHFSEGRAAVKTDQRWGF